ncbi:MAG: fasciclin domain-containing protein [Solirubrobacteraceae bacterium]|nr:fasciclin domain-containing protein [Solirubrobacteraceae bacterium]
MRSRPFTAVAAAFVLALSSAACGGDDEPVAVEPTSGDIVPPSEPVDGVPTPLVETPTGSTGESGSDASNDDGESGGKKAAERKPSDNLLTKVAADSTDLTNFTTALNAAGLAGTLGNDGPYTVFAPNNDGFAKLGTRLDTLLQPASKAELVNILSFHIVKGEYKAKDLKNGKLLTTLQGTRVRVTKKDNAVMLGNSNVKGQVVSSDLIGGNGVIHVIDTVLAPKTK